MTPDSDNKSCGKIRGRKEMGSEREVRYKEASQKRASVVDHQSGESI